MAEHPYSKACELYRAKLDGSDISYSEIYKQVFDLEISNEEARKRLRFVRDSMAASSSPTLNSFEQEVVFRDEINALRQEKRNLARLSRLESIVREEIHAIEPSQFESPVIGESSCGSKYAILQISDIHYGLEIENAWNKYNTDICFERLDKLAAQAIKLSAENGINKIVIAFQGDLISGNIRNIIRLQNQVDLVRQIIGVTKLLINFISKLLANGLALDIYFVDGNHERVTPNKDDNLPDENLLGIIKWVIEETFENIPAVTIHNNKFGSRLAVFDLGELRVASVHGDYDKFQNLYSNLSAITKDAFDIILTAHNHNTHFQDINNCFVISNGSVCGPDEYSISLRLLSRATQNFIVLDGKNITVTPIVLD